LKRISEAGDGWLLMYKDGRGEILNREIVPKIYYTEPRFPENSKMTDAIDSDPKTAVLSTLAKQYRHLTHIDRRSLLPKIDRPSSLPQQAILTTVAT